MFGIFVARPLLLNNFCVAENSGFHIILVKSEIEKPLESRSDKQTFLGPNLSRLNTTEYFVAQFINCGCFFTPLFCSFNMKVSGVGTNTPWFL